MNEHIEQGDRVVLVSASIENYLEPFSREFKVEIICTQLEVIDGILTGNFKSPNCYGLEKVKRIKDEVDLSVYKEIHVYGDSAGDTEMLDLATHPFYRNFS